MGDEEDTRVRTRVKVCQSPPVGCGKVIGTSIRNPETARRYLESGLCKDCQDRVYK